MCALSFCLSSCQQLSGARRGGSSREVGAGKEVALTSSNVWLSLLETPSWGWPPLPFLSLSFKHVPSKSPSLQTPPVEPSPDLLPRRPTFLRLATFKVPAQARTQILPPCPPPARIQTTRNTQRHGWTQQPPVHTGGSTRSASDPGSQTSTNTATSSPSFPAAHHTLRSTHGFQHAVLTDTHRHSHTLAVPCRETSANHSTLSPCTAQPRHHHRPVRLRHRDTKPVPPVLSCTQPSTDSHTWWSPAPPKMAALQGLWERDTARLDPGHLH